MTKKDNIALIGYGYWGKKLYKYLKTSENFNLRYVFFPSLKKYDNESIRKTFGEEFTPDINVIWQDSNVSSVVVATPIETHFNVVLSALSSEKHVLIEKPLTIKINDAMQLDETARTHHVKLETEYTYTYSKALEHAQKIIHNGIIGKIESISIELKQLGRFLSSDVYLLLGSHALSILNLFSSISDMVFSSIPLITRNKITTAAIINFKTTDGECRGYIDINLHCPQREKKLIIYGEKGTVIYDPDKKEALTLILYQANQPLLAKDLIEKTIVFNFDENNNIKYALENFYDVIHEKKESNIASAIMINKVLASLRQEAYSNLHVLNV